MRTVGVEFQVLFNIAFGIVCGLLGWVLNTVWGEVKALQAEDRRLQDGDKAIADKVAQIEVLVAGNYVTREEFFSSMNTLYAKIDRIIETLAEKANR